MSVTKRQLYNAYVNTEFSKQVCHYPRQADCGVYLDGLDILLAGINLLFPFS